MSEILMANRPNDWGRAEGGNTSVMFALMLMPMMFLMGGAVDYGRAIQERNRMRDAADSAAIAAAAMIGQSSEARSQRITAMANANLSGTSGISTEVNRDGTKIAVTMKKSVPTSFVRLAGIESIPVSATATAEEANGSSALGRACMLALDPNSDDGIHVQGTNQISYPNCWAHTNSTKSTSINGNGNAVASGQGTSTAGGYVGSNFTPAPMTARPVVADPYATTSAYPNPDNYDPIFTPPSIPNVCVANALNLKKGNYTLSPGRYCNGLNIQANATVTLNPGVYIIDNGEFNVQSGSTVSGQDILLYFSGANARMTLIGGGSVNLVGRKKNSTYEGFLAIAHPKAWYLNSSTIQGGGNFDLEGVVYLPTQRLAVGGNGTSNGNSKYFGMVAKDFYFTGNGVFNLKARQDLSPLPEILPTIASNKVRLTN